MSRTPPPTLRQRAFAYLARRDYSRLELRQKLFPHWQETDESLDRLLDDLTERGYLSDERATTQFLHAKRSRLGTKRITQALRHKGIDEELIQAALPELQASEMDTARSIWQRKFAAPHKTTRKKPNKCALCCHADSL